VKQLNSTGKPGATARNKKKYDHVLIMTTDPAGHPLTRTYDISVSEHVRLEVPRRAALRVTAGSLRELKAYTADEIYSLVVPKRTLARREQKKEPLTIEETDKALRLARIATYAEKVFGNKDKAARWLRKPKRLLEGETPVVYLASETGARIVEEMLTQIDNGIVP